MEASEVVPVSEETSEGVVASLRYLVRDENGAIHDSETPDGGDVLADLEPEG